MNRSTKIKIWVFSIWACIALIVFIWGRIQGPIVLERFHEKRLQGKITYIYSSSGGTRICLNNETKRHFIFTEYNDIVKSFFNSFVKVGDSIFKAPNDKYIHVFRGKDEFLFETKKE